VSMRGRRKVSFNNARDIPRENLARNARDDVLSHHTLGAQPEERRRIWKEILQ